MEISNTFPVKPRDSRCRYWCKKIHADRLPLPGQIDGANSLPGEYLKKGDVEIEPGEFIFEGEEKHHNKQRGWDYWAYTYGEAGYKSLPFGTATKDAIKLLASEDLISKERARDLLRGSGDIAAAVRRAHLEIIKRELGITTTVTAWVEARNAQLVALNEQEEQSEVA